MNYDYEIRKSRTCHTVGVVSWPLNNQTILVEVKSEKRFKISYLLKKYFWNSKFNSGCRRKLKPQYHISIQHKIISICFLPRCILQIKLVSKREMLCRFLSTMQMFWQIENTTEKKRYYQYFEKILECSIS